MIKLTRIPAPAMLVRWAPRWKQALLTAIAAHRAGEPVPKKQLWEKYNKSYVKKSLKRMFNGKCAYCESKIEHVAHPHIEHYRPKAQFPDLTFEWDNLLLACGICNTHKGTAFPLDQAGNPLLLNPCEDEPGEHLFFRKARVVALSDRGETTITLTSLNRDALFDKRRDYIRMAHFIYCCAQQGDNTARQLWQDIIHDKAEFVGMIRQATAVEFQDQVPPREQ